MIHLAKAFLPVTLVLTISACSGGTEDPVVPHYEMPFKADSGRLEVYDGSSYHPIFIKGMNMGIAVPGTQPGELAATAEDYERWLNMLGEIGINSIRLYTLHYPRFYQKLRAYNLAHKEAPIYVFHGIWLDEENPSKNLRDMQSHYDDNIVESVECVHGARIIPERKGRAHGTFDADISPWIIGWLVGREIFPDEVHTTNALPDARKSYDGGYVSLPTGSETEVWWAERIDKIAAYEKERFGQMRPISVSSWPTLDPLKHPTEGSGAAEDQEQLDLANLDTSRYPAGYFASYHAYPYYPDFMNEEPEFVAVSDDQGPNSYLGYLRKLRAHYYPKPLLVAEVGVPSSWGDAHYATSGMDHGGLDEEQQGRSDARLYRNAYDAETAGAVLFAWIDEWWKRTWIVDELSMPRDRYKLWHNVTSPEQNFGLLAFELAPPDFDRYEATSGTGRVKSVRVAADAEFFHVKIALDGPLADGDSMNVGFDTYADERGETILPDGKKTSQRSEFALSITAPSKADLFVTEAYDQFGVWHDTQLAIYTKDVFELPAGRLYHSIASDGAPWNLVRWKNNGVHGSDDGVFRFPETVQDIGRMRIRQSSAPATSQDAVVLDGAEIRVRIPWTLLQVTDPSGLRVLDDDPKTRDRETILTDGIRVAVSLGADLLETPRVKWQGWNEAPHYTERKKASYSILTDALKALPNQ